MLIYILIVLVTLTILHYRKDYRYWSDRNVKGPRPFPFFGTFLHWLLGNLRELDKKMGKKYGKFYGEYMGRTPLFVVSDAETAKSILITNFHIFNQSQKPDQFKGIFEGTLPVMSGPEWKRIRSAISPIFTTGKLRRACEHMEQPMQHFFDNLDELLRQGKADKMAFKQFTKGYALDVIANFVFAIEVNSYKQKDDPFVKNVLKVASFRSIPFLLTQLLPQPFSRQVSKYVFHNDAVDYFSEITKQILKKRQENKDVKYKDFVELLLESTDDMTEQEIVAHCVLFFFAGMETVSSALSIITSDMAIHQDHQERILNEIQTEIGDKPLDYDNVYGLEYLDAFIHESLRMTAPAPRLVRHPKSDFTLPESEIVLEAGRPIMVNVGSIHFDPEVYPDPHTFNPERFLKANRTADQYWLAFGDGPKNCVGLRFAILEVKYFIVRILQNYRVELADGVKVPIQYRSLAFLSEPSDLRIKFIPKK